MAQTMPLRILQLISSPAAGGAEVYVKGLSIELTRRGAQSFIGFLGHAADVGRSPDYERQFLAELDAAGIPYFFVGHETRHNPLLGAWRVRQLCVEHNINIYHSHLKYGIAFSVLLLIPRVHTHHTILPQAGRLMYSLFNLFVDAYVGISAVCADKLAGYTRRPVTTIFNAVNPEKLLPRAPTSLDVTAPLRCVAVGSVHAPKNYGLMVQAVALLPAEVRRAIRVSIAGEGPPEMMAALRAQIAESHLEDTIVLLGNRSDIPQLLNRSQLFLMSSAWEGFPIALIEAALSGLPCIVTDVGGCAELIDVCRNGIVVPPHDAPAFANAIASLVREPERLVELARNAIERSATFTISTAAEGHLTLYRRLLGSR